MGTLLHKSTKIEQSEEFKNLTYQMKRYRMREIFEVLQYIHDHYPKCYSMVYEVFDDIFGSLIDDSQPMFDRLQEYRLVDMYEAIAAFAIFSGDTYEVKAGFLFRLFDFDSSYTLEQDELVKTITVIMRAVCKVVGIKPPKEDLTKMLAETCFQLMDEDQSGYIDFNEFKNWIEQDWQLQEFLLKFAGTNTYPYAKRRLQTMISEHEQGFLKASDGQKKIEGNLILPYLRESLSHFDEELILKLNEILLENSKKNSLDENDTKVKKRDFLDVMRAWCSYSATDYNDQNTLSTQELKIMFWIYEDEEPDTFRLRQELNIIDSDMSGTIERMEWIEHLLQENRETGTSFKGTMKKAYEKFENSLGIIDVQCTKDILLETFSHKIERNSSKYVQENQQKNIDKLSREIMKEFKIKDISQVNWKEFKNFIDDCFDDHENLVNQLNDPANFNKQLQAMKQDHQQKQEEESKQQQQIQQNK